MLTKEYYRKPCEGLFAFKYLRIPKNIIIAIGGFLEVIAAVYKNSNITV